MEREEILVLDPRDNVGVALLRLEAGMKARAIRGDTHLVLTIKDEIPPWHKLSLCPIPPGGKVYKYGHPIGLATRPIEPGMHVHTHNLEDTDVGF